MACVYALTGPDGMAVAVLARTQSHLLCLSQKRFVSLAKVKCAQATTVVSAAPVSFAKDQICVYPQHKGANLAATNIKPAKANVCVNLAMSEMTMAFAPSRKPVNLAAMK